MIAQLTQQAQQAQDGGDPAARALQYGGAGLEDGDDFSVFSEAGTHPLSTPLAPLPLAPPCHDVT